VVCCCNWRSTFSSGNSSGKWNNLLCKPDNSWLRKQYPSGCRSDNKQPAAPTGNATQSFCASDNPTIASLLATGTAIQWYAAATGGAPLAPATALVNATTYYASQTIAGCESNNRLAVAVIVSNPATPTGNATQTFCASTNPTIASLLATGQQSSGMRLQLAEHL